jgi:hypothetical protein
MYSMATKAPSDSRPMAEKSQPMALSGRRATTSAPTTMKAVNAGRYSRTTLSPAPLPFSTARTPVEARPAA